MAIKFVRNSAVGDSVVHTNYIRFTAGDYYNQIYTDRDASAGVEQVIFFNYTSAGTTQVNFMFTYPDTSYNGAVYDSTIGWLHEQLFNAVSNCIVDYFNGPWGAGAGNAGNCPPQGANVVNCYGAGNIYGSQFELLDQGGTLGHRHVNYYQNCDCNCACDCGNCA